MGALNKLFVQPAVWRRVWIMQEVSCAPKVIIKAGELELNWEVLDRFLDGGIAPDAFHKPFSHQGYIDSIKGTFVNPQILQHQRQIVKTMMMKKQQLQERPKNIALLDVIARFRLTNATDPRDKIFALLGLSKETMGVIADYRKPTRQVYMDFVEKYINHEKNLDIFCQSQWDFVGQGEENPHNLSSWVPNFSSTKSRQLLFAQRGIYNAGKPTCKTPCQINLSERGDLRLSGVYVGVISTMKEPTLPQLRKEWDYRAMRHLDQSEVLMEKWLPDHLQLSRPKDLVSLSSNIDAQEQIWLDHVDSLTGDVRAQGSKGKHHILSDNATSDEDSKTHPTKLDQTIAPPKYSNINEILESHGLQYEDTINNTPTKITNLTNFEAYWRTIAVDTVQFPTKRLTDFDFKRGTLIFDAWRTGALSSLKGVSQYGFRMNEMREWRFAVLGNGLFSMVPLSAECGDVVCVLDGAKVPVLLREVSGGSGRELEENEKEKFFVFVGPVYVHGIMDGEAYEWTREKRFDFYERDFSIV